MHNQLMQAKLKSGEAIDVSRCPRTVTGDYLLASYKDGCEYCVAKTEEWITSIGLVTRPLPSVMADNRARVLQPGEYLASTSNKYYTPNIEDPTKCVFLR